MSGCPDLRVTKAKGSRAGTPLGLSQRYLEASASLLEPFKLCQWLRMGHQTSAPISQSGDTPSFLKRQASPLDMALGWLVLILHSPLHISQKRAFMHWPSEPLPPHCAPLTTVLSHLPESQCPGLSLASTLPALGAGLLVGRHSVPSNLSGLPSREEAKLLDS